MLNRLEQKFAVSFIRMKISTAFSHALNFSGVDEGSGKSECLLIEPRIYPTTLPTSNPQLKEMYV